MSKFKPISLLVLMVIIILPLGVGMRNIASVQAQDTSICPSPDNLPPQLAIGLWGRVASGLSHNIREDATIQAAITNRVPDNDIFRVLGGPRCSDGYVWWQVDYTGQTGWMAEGDAVSEEYWLEALAGQETPAPENDDALTPSGCLKPPEDYSRALVNGAQVNARTLVMLDHAQALYREEGGLVIFRNAIMQGSYNPGAVSASFGTHDGGGALDISVRDPIDRRVLTAEIEPMLRALRFAGFAAWLRDTDSLYPGSPIHIHAIAIGDAELSPAAGEQIDGTFGYLRGYDGLPRDDGIPQPDTSGDMVLCQWMVEMGFQDLRAQ
jgi:hypothetical protein